MKVVRPFIAIVLVWAMCLNVVGYCFFSLLIITHKKSTFYRLFKGNYDKVELVNFTSGDLIDARWEHEKEFELDGNMYDIVKSEQMGGVLHIICKKDSKEDHLKKQKRKAAEQATAKHMAKFNQIFVQLVSPMHVSIKPPIQYSKNASVKWKSYNHYPSLPELPPKV